MSAETKLRAAASEMLAAYRAAVADGYVVQWPSRAEGLAKLVMSETYKVGEATGVPLQGITVPADGLVRDAVIGDADEPEPTKPTKVKTKLD